MSIETRSNTKLGKSKTKRVSIDDTVKSATLPDNIKKASFHNNGSSDILIRINASGTDFITLEPAVWLQGILVAGSTIEARCKSGESSILEIIFEG